MDTVRLDHRDGGGFARWREEFTARAAARAAAGDPDWARGARLEPAVVRSIQRFQVGEDGDGAHLIAAADRAGDPDYAAAVRLFVAEENNHARLLGRLLATAGADTVAAHWSDTVFVRLRRLLGLRAELMTLMVAEVVALHYYRLLAEGCADPLAARVAALILDDERRHVPFHCQRLRSAFADTGRAARWAAVAVWWTVLAGAAVLVSVDHGPALRHLGCRRRDFALEVLRLFAAVTPYALPAAQRGGKRRTRSSPARTSPRPSVLDVVTYSDPSGATATVRRRP